jgi:hypothetical protein
MQCVPGSSAREKELQGKKISVKRKGGAPGDFWLMEKIRRFTDESSWQAIEI